MNKIISIITTSLLVIISTLLVMSFIKTTITQQSQLTVGSNVSTDKCTITTSTATVVGNALSGTVLAANETRAYARISNLANATNTIALSLDEGAAAVTGSGVFLSTSTVGVPFVEFGRATTLPYTGAVTGIASAGTTTVLVTECSY